MKRKDGEWCEKHDDWFPSGCYKCKPKLFLKDPTNKELREYEKRYKAASKESKCPSFKYYDFYVPDEDKETIAKWWAKMKDVRWNPS